jgi:D-alanine-D-alanine ligase
MHIAILHPAVPPDASLEDQDTLVQVRTISETLKALGHLPFAVACSLDLAAVRQVLISEAPQMAFNLVESVDGADSLQYVPTALLDTLGIPYTGNSTEAIFQTTHKLLAKQLLHLAGLPTPGWLAAGCHADPSPSLLPPCIVKAVWEHASRGLDDQNVILQGDAQVVRDRLEAFAARSGRPCFAEQFIAGREFNLAILDGAEGPEVLPPAEIDFSAFPPDKPRIVGHRAKWETDSFEFSNTPRSFDFSAQDRSLLGELRELSLRCWQLFALRGYARVDFRVDADRRPWILEINTNPCLSPDAGFAAAVARAGIPFAEAIRRILERTRTVN